MQAATGHARVSAHGREIPGMPRWGYRHRMAAELKVCARCGLCLSRQADEFAEWVELDGEGLVCRDCQTKCERSLVLAALPLVTQLHEGIREWRGRSPIDLDPAALEVLISAESSDVRLRAKRHRIASVAAVGLAACLFLFALLPEALGDRPYDPHPSAWGKKIEWVKRVPLRRTAPNGHTRRSVPRPAPGFRMWLAHRPERPASNKKPPATRGFLIGAPRFELGTSSPPD